MLQVTDKRLDKIAGEEVVQMKDTEVGRCHGNSRPCCSVLIVCFRSRLCSSCSRKIGICMARCSAVS